MYDEQIERFRNLRDEALAVVRDIDEGGWRFKESVGDGPMRDVTSEWRAKQAEIAQHMEELAVAYEGLRDREAQG